MADQKAPGDDLTLTGSDASGSQRQGECLGLRWKPSNSAVDDSGTESGEDLRLLSPELLREIQSALSRLEGALPGLEPSRRDTVTELVNRLQSCLKIPPPSVPPVPPPRRFANKKVLRNRHTVGVTREELADARRWITETDMQRQASAGSLLGKDESVIAKVFRPVKFIPPTKFTDKNNTRSLHLQKMELIRKVFRKPILHSAGYFMEPSPQVAVVSYIEPYIKERSLSDTGSLLDYDPSLNLFTPEQSVQIAVHKAAINKQISQEELKRRDSSDDGDISSTEDDGGTNYYSNVSSAQRLLQLASENPKKASTPSRFHNRSSKKQKIKRANTIDIPKPASFYDHSSGEEYGASADEGNHSDFAAPGRKFNEKKLPTPSFEPKTENDIKFLAFLKHANEAAEQKVLTYNPSARGGKHWSNRFSNIRTAFEDPEPKPNPIPKSLPAKSFWQNVQTPTPPIKAPVQSQPHNKSHTFHQSKLPWSVKTEEDGVVVGSLTVAKHPPGPINQFTHASKSAFKPVEKKSNISPASGTVKQLATQKFSIEPPKPTIKQYLHQEKPGNKPQQVLNHLQKDFNAQRNPGKQFSSSSSTAHWHYNIPQMPSQNLNNNKRDSSRISEFNSSVHSKQSLSNQYQNQNIHKKNNPQIPEFASSVHPKQSLSNQYQNQNIQKRDPLQIPEFNSSKQSEKLHKEGGYLPSHVPAQSNIKPTVPKSVESQSQFIGPPPPKHFIPNPATVTQKPLDHEITKKKMTDPPLVKHPPPDSYLKAHPRNPEKSQSSENLRSDPSVPLQNNYQPNLENHNYIPPTVHNRSYANYEQPFVNHNYDQNPGVQTYVSVNQVSQSNFTPLRVDNNYHKNSDVQTYSLENPTTEKCERIPNQSNIQINGNNLGPSVPTPLLTDQKKSTTFEVNSSPPIIISDDSYSNDYAGIVNNNNRFSPSPSNISKSPFTMSPYKEEPAHVSDYSAEHLLPQQPPIPLLSPHNLSSSGNCERLSPVRTIYNNVSPRHISGPEIVNNTHSPFIPQQSKSPSLKYEDDDSIPVSPYLWGRESNEGGSNRSSPLECREEKAVSKVMGQAQCQQAVTVNNRTRHRFDSGKKIESELKLQVQQSARQKALSPSFPNVLQKSESWHQIVKEQMQQAKQAPPLPKISKTKSSHALAFPKQFEASLAPENLAVKQSTVNQYLSPSTSPPKRSSKPTTPTSRPVLKTQESVPLNDVDLDNVDEAFESIFRESNKKRNSK